MVATKNLNGHSGATVKLTPKLVESASTTVQRGVLVRSLLTPGPG